MTRAAPKLTELEIHVLCMLGTAGAPSHPFRIVERLSSIVGRKVGGGTLSKMFKRFEDRKWITIEFAGSYAGGQRHLGRLTPQGRRVLEIAVRRLRKSFDSFNKMAGPQEAQG